MQYHTGLLVVFYGTGTMNQLSILTILLMITAAALCNENYMQINAYLYCGNEECRDVCSKDDNCTTAVKIRRNETGLIECYLLGGDNS